MSRGTDAVRYPHAGRSTIAIGFTIAVAIPLFPSIPNDSVSYTAQLLDGLLRGPNAAKVVAYQAVQLPLILSEWMAATFDILNTLPHDRLANVHAMF
jgi:hypothetical protein